MALNQVSCFIIWSAAGSCPWPCPLHKYNIQPLLQKISKFGLNRQFYTDGYQIYHSAFIHKVDNLITSFEDLMTGRSNILKPIDARDTIKFGKKLYLFHIQLKNLGVIFELSFSMTKEINHLIKSMHIEVRKISKIRHLISIKIAKLWVNGLFKSKNRKTVTLCSSMPPKKSSKVCMFYRIMLQIYTKKKKKANLIQPHFFSDCSIYCQEIKEKCIKYVRLSLKPWTLTALCR